MKGFTDPRVFDGHANVGDMPATQDPEQDLSREWWVYLDVRAPQLEPKVTLHCGECGAELFTQVTPIRDPQQFHFGALAERVRDHINEMHPGGRP